MYEAKPDDPLFVDAELTPLTESEATYYLREAYNKIVGSYPSIDSLAILWAQAGLETGRFSKAMFNANWGNIKKIVGQKYTSYKCSEIINGKNEWFFPYHPQTFFSAWGSPLDGAIAYLNFLIKRPRYAKAWEQIKLGNPQQYCIELKNANYFTADLAQYTRGVVSLTNEFKNKSEKLLSWKPEDSRPELPTIIPTGDEYIPLDLPRLDLDYHPEQENIKPIDVPASGIIEILIRIFEYLFQGKR